MDTKTELRTGVTEKPYKRRNPTGCSALTRGRPIPSHPAMQLWLTMYLPSSAATTDKSVIALCR